MAIRFTREARHDIAEILSYGVQHFTRERAESFVVEVIEKAALIEAHPEIGRVSDEVKFMGEPDRREFPIQQYMILYQIQADGIIIEAIIPKGRPRLA